jgi:diacylglycerol kinase
MKIISGLARAFFLAFRGILIAFKKERNVKIHFAAVLIVSIAGTYFKITMYEWISVILCFALVISLEMINTAIEILADKISSEPDELIGKAKDVAAGAVFIAAIFSVIVAAIIFRKYLF